MFVLEVSIHIDTPACEKGSLSRPREITSSETGRSSGAEALTESLDNLGIVSH